MNDKNLYSGLKSLQMCAESTAYVLVNHSIVVINVCQIFRMDGLGFLEEESVT